VLIKRTQSQHFSSDRRGSVAAALSGATGGLDRRAFLRRAGLAGGALAALNTLPLGSVRKAEAAAAGPLSAGATVRKSICTHCSVGCTVTAEVLNEVWVGQEPSWEFPDQSRLALREGRIGARTRAQRSAAALSDEARQRAMDARLVGYRHQRDRRQAAPNSREVGRRLRLLARIGQDDQRSAYLFRKLGAFWGTNNTDHQARICHSTPSPA
jgi:Uncharacterized anaerobic dehydrogenase